MVVFETLACCVGYGVVLVELVTIAKLVSEPYIPISEHC